jgi:hypothetical protein
MSIVWLAGPPAPIAATITLSDFSKLSTAGLFPDTMSMM